MFEKTKAKKYVRQLKEIVKSSATHIPIFNENRDFVEFELGFYFYFVYDYKVYHKMKPALRKTICDLFIDEIHVIRKSNFTKKELDEFFNNRMIAFSFFIKQSKKIVEFLSKASDYINTMLTISIKENGYANGILEDLPLIKEVIEPNIFTELIEETLDLHSTIILR